MRNDLIILPFLFCLVWFLPKGTTQIPAPDFLCVTNDTLNWDFPTLDPCGPFVAYNIYAANTPEGPYTLLTSIMDQGEDQFYHQASSTQLWYYYLETQQNCPGVANAQSDTLDNLIPAPGPICAVSVTDDEEVVIHWEASPSPEVVGYIVSRETPMGLITLDTVLQDTTYLDVSASPDDAPESYIVVALDACGNKSLVGQAHQTMFLESEAPGTCDPSVLLRWTPYDDFAAGLDHYEVQVAIDGGPFVVSETFIPPDATSFVFNYQNYPGFAGFSEGTLCFKVVARSAGPTPKSSRSSASCQMFATERELAYIDLHTVSFDASNQIDLEWSWDNTINIAETYVERQINNASPEIIADVPLADPIPQTFTLLAIDALPPSVPTQLAYTVTGLNVCDRSAISNAVMPILLQGTTDGSGRNVLDWTAFSSDLLQSATYELIRLGNNGTEISLSTFSDTEALTYLDIIDLAETAVFEACYVVRANVNLVLSDGRSLSRSVRSNTVCLSPDAQIYIPNVFAPAGNNRTFRPFLGFGEPESYTMMIYDRYGGQVFSSQDILTAWDGTYRGRMAPTGTYLYVIRLTLNGVDIERTGDITLLR